MKQIAQALYTINKHAKTQRDNANYVRFLQREFEYSYTQELKAVGLKNYNYGWYAERVYDLKNKVMNKLIANNSMRYLGYTKTWNGYYGTTFWKCYKFCGLSFHIKAEEVTGKKLKPLPVINSELDQNKNGNMSIKTAIRILEEYLNTHPLEKFSN